MSMNKPKRLNVNLSVKRFDKLKKYAESKEKNMTQVIEGWIDKAPNVEESIPYSHSTHSE